MDNNYAPDKVSKTEMRCENYDGEKATLVSRLINSKLWQITIQDPRDITEYPRADNVCTYFSITDEMFIKIADRPVLRFEDIGAQND